MPNIRATEYNGSMLTDATSHVMQDWDNIQIMSKMYTQLLFRHINMNCQVYRYTNRYNPVNVLDVGCGNGSAIRLYAGKNFQTILRGTGILKYTGLDLDSHEIDKARAAWGTGRYSKKVDARFYVQDITESLLCGMDSQHVIWCMETIEHVPLEKAPDVLRYMYYALHPEGRLVISTPAPLGDELVWPESHTHEFKRDEFRSMLELAGFTIENMWGVGANMRNAKKAMTQEELRIYNLLRLRISPYIAGTVVQALNPALADDLLWLCRKE